MLKKINTKKNKKSFVRYNEIYVCLITLKINAEKTARGGAYDDEYYKLLHRSSFNRLSAPKVGKTIAEMRNKGIIPSENQMIENKENLATLPGYNLFLGMSAVVEAFKDSFDKCSCCALTVIDPDDDYLPPLEKTLVHLQNPTIAATAVRVIVHTVYQNLPPDPFFFFSCCWA